MKKFSIIISIFTFLLFSAYANAQIQPSIDGIDITAEPSTPAEGQDTTISLESFLEDVDSASIGWIVNGKAEKYGIGEKKIKVKAPKTGKSLNIIATIKLSNGKVVEKMIILKSGSVEIVWESRGYTPPFYKGRNNFSYQNWVRLVAIPHISINGTTEVNPKDLIYIWKKGGKYIEDAKGYGKQSVDIKADDLPKVFEISVDVYPKDQSITVSNELDIIPSEPSVLFYEMNPLYGVLFNKSINNQFILGESEVGIYAAPFGFNKNPSTNPMTYNWSVNNVEQPDLLKNQTIILKPKGDASGSSLINLEVRNVEEILQAARLSLLVSFKKK